MPIMQNKLEFMTDDEWSFALYERGIESNTPSDGEGKKILYDSDSIARRNAYIKKIQENFYESVNFGLESEGGAAAMLQQPYGDKLFDNPFWKSMKKVEEYMLSVVDKPEVIEYIASKGVNNEKNNNCIIYRKCVMGIASLRAMLYLIVNWDYAVELAYSYDLHFDIKNPKGKSLLVYGKDYSENIFHEILKQLDCHNKNTNWHHHGAWFPPAYNRISDIGLTYDKFANHIDSCVAIKKWGHSYDFNPKRPFTKKEVERQLKVLFNVYEPITVMVDEKHGSSVREEALMSFINGVKESSTGCAAESLKESLTGLEEIMFRDHSSYVINFNKMMKKDILHFSLSEIKDAIELNFKKDLPDTYLMLKKDKNKKAKNDFIRSHLKFFQSYHGSKIQIIDGGEIIEILPQNYKKLIENLKQSFEDCFCCIDEHNMPEFYSDIENSVEQILQMVEKMPKQDAPKQDAPKQDAPKQDAPKQDAPKQDNNPLNENASNFTKEEPVLQSISSGLISLAITNWYLKGIEAISFDFSSSDSFLKKTAKFGMRLLFNVVAPTVSANYLINSKKINYTAVGTGMVCGVALGSFDATSKTINALIPHSEEKKRVTKKI